MTHLLKEKVFHLAIFVMIVSELSSYKNLPHRKDILHHMLCKEIIQILSPRVKCVVQLYLTDNFNYLNCVGVA